MKFKCFFISSFILLIFFISSCSTFPTEQLSLDLTNTIQPVMLNKQDVSQKMRSFNFKEGYESQSVTTSNGNNGTTSTASESHYVNDNFSQQLQNFFIQDPE